jgi:hypothetical protein
MKRHTASASNPTALHLRAGKHLLACCVSASVRERVTRIASVGGILACLLVAASAASASTPEPREIVGEVSLVLGKAWVRHDDGSLQTLRMGETITESDIIETGGNGHVHVRFVDQALVSVRPSSKLEIVNYRYDAANPAASSVKFNLVEGVTRAISGDAAKHARGSFRMNTPVAAIGVRGTDFVVSASADNVRASVTEGAIVIAPFSSECRAESFGPCSQNAQELASGMSQIAEISAQVAEVQLIQVAPPQQREQVIDQPAPVVVAVAQVETTSNAGSTESAGVKTYTDSVGTLAVNNKIEQSIQTPPVKPPPVTPPPVTPPPVVLPDFTPAVALSSNQLTADARLVWGRWSGAAVSQERITTTYSIAAADGRKITVGSDHYALFRAEGANQQFKPGLGIVGFDLASAQVTYNIAGTSQLVAVRDGELSIDFDESLFSTSLDLSHPTAGDYQFAAGGRLFDNGIFRVRNDNTFMAGSLSLDSSEAGYFFERTLDNGAMIEGITLWDARP